MLIESFYKIQFIESSQDLRKMNDFKVQLYKNQQQYLAKLLPKQYSFQLYKVRKNINDYQYIQFDKKFKRQQSIILSRKQSLSKSNKESVEVPFSSESKIEKIPLVKQEPLSQIQQKCLSLLKKLRKHQSSHPFRCPVDPKFLQVPEYQEIVLQPIDLKTIEQNVKKNQYDHIGQLQRDIYKMIMNSYKFNQKETSVFQRTMNFQAFFVQLLKQNKKVQIKVQKEQIEQIFEKPIQKQEINVQIKLCQDQDIKYQNQGDQYSNVNFNKLMTQFESKGQPQISEPQISSYNKISASDVQKNLSSLIRRLNMHPLSRIKRMNLTSKFNLLETTMSLGQRRKLFQKIFKLRQQDHLHVVQMLTRNKKIVLNENKQFQIDIQRMDSKILREIQNFIVLRNQSIEQTNIQQKIKKVQKQKKLKRKSSKRVKQDESYHSSQGTKIKLKYLQQDDEYLPQNQISEEMINESYEDEQKIEKLDNENVEYQEHRNSAEAHQRSIEQNLQQVYQEEVTPVNSHNQNNRNYNNFHDFHGGHQQESNQILHQLESNGHLHNSNNRIRQIMEPLDPIDQIDLYFNTPQEQVRKFLWEQ